MVPLSYRKYLTSAYEYYQERVLEEIEMNMPRMYGEKKVVSKVCKGDERMAAIRKTLNELGYERSKLQRQFHDKFIQAVALHLYKDDPDVDLEQIMRMNNWSDLRQSVLCLTPRRFGKTTAVALFIAAYAMCVPHSTQSVFSTGRRASQKLLELIRDIIKKTHTWHPTSSSATKKNSRCRLDSTEDASSVSHPRQRRSEVSEVTCCI